MSPAVDAMAPVIMIAACHCIDLSLVIITQLSFFRVAPGLYCVGVRKMSAP